MSDKVPLVVPLVLVDFMFVFSALIGSGISLLMDGLRPDCRQIDEHGPVE